MIIKYSAYICTCIYNCLCTSRFKGHTTEHALKLDTRKEELFSNFIGNNGHNPMHNIMEAQSNIRAQQALKQRRHRANKMETTRERTAKIKSSTERQCKAERKMRNSAACKTVENNSNRTEKSK